MSCQRGNTNRSRPQKHQNHTTYKNNLHDTSQKTKFINNLEVANVCERCKNIIEWKIKYKKYKTLKTPAKCIKCQQKTVKRAYHNMCLACAKQEKVCPKCCKKEEIIEAKPDKEEQIKLDAELNAILQTLSERKRRTFLRYVNQKTKKNSKQNTLELSTNANKTESKDISENVTEPRSKTDLLLKLKLLAVTEEENDIFNNDIDNESNNDNSNTDSDDNI